MTKLRKPCQILRNLIPNARRGERGSILILAALMSVLVIGSAGLAVDVSRMYAARAEVSRAVDAAALAGVLEFNGQASGLTAAQDKAQAYMTANEPSATSNIIADGATNKMTIKANKSVKLFFLSLFGFNSASVYGHAVAGFQDQTIDAVMVVDSTGSMDGTPINNAKTAATNFVNLLLGSSPSGNVVVGATPFRGCNRGTTQSATVPFLASDTAHDLCVNQNTEITGLTSNKSTLTTGLSNICPSDSCPGGSGTNVCTGLAKGWQVLEGSGNHTASPNNRRYVVLLTDGDNYYNGGYTYQSSPYASPHTYQTWPCQPPSACTGFAGTPCHTGAWTGSPVTVASDGFDTGNFTGGTGWLAGWTSTNSPSVTTTTTQAGTYKAQLNQTDAITRSVNLSTVSDASMSYYLRANSTSWSTSDRAYVETSPDNTTWTTRATYCYGCGVSGVTSLSSSGYNQYSISLTSLVGDASAYVRFRTNITSGSTHYLYADTVAITDPATSSDGYLDGTDSSGGTSCTTTVPRERQLDVETLNMSRAMKLDGVEVFVVAFGTCNGSNATVYNNSVAAQCNPIAQISPAVVPSPAGPIGNTDDDNTADNRLLKCIASSTVGTNDHYFYAASATDLPNIFTTIAAQIAHRLVE